MRALARTIAIDVASSLAAVVSSAALSSAAVVSIVVMSAGCAGPERRAEEPRRRAAIDGGAPALVASASEDAPRLDVPEDTSAPQGPACMRGDQCARGLQCRGAPGCESSWACGEARECMAESVAYCDCDGTTFYASGGCANRPYAHVGPCESVGELVAAGTELGIPDWDEPISRDARACTSSTECERGRTCWGVAGCATQWSCVRARCRRDSVAYCGCDGQTFQASSTCPGRPFVHRGACRDAVARADSPPAADRGATAARGPVAETAPSRAGAATSTPRSAGAAASGRTSSEPTGSRGAAAAPAAMSVPAEPPGPTGCRSSRECPRGQVCQGEPGCGTELDWRCAPPQRQCIADTQVFCDCAGRDFRASMFCPGRPFRHRGSCEIDRMLELSGAAVR
jgi:hypothetical protein